MRHLLGGLLLATAFSAQAADIGVSLGGSLKHYDDTYGELGTGPDRLNVHMRFAEHWQLGLESLYRKGRRESNPAGSYGNLPIVYKVEAFSYGLEAKYLQRLGSRHQLGVAVSGGYNHYEEAPEGVMGIDGPGSYYAFSVAYDYFLTPHFSLGLAWRQQMDNVDADNLPPTNACNINCSGLNNIVYNPYAGLDNVQTGSFQAKDRNLALVLGYEF